MNTEVSSSDIRFVSPPGEAGSLGLAADAAAFAYYDIDLRTGRLYCSPGLASIVGPRTEAELSLLPGAAPEFLFPEDGGAAEQMRRSFDPFGTGNVESMHRIVRADGEPRWIMIKGRTYFDRNSSPLPVRSAGGVTDVTKPRRDQETQREACRRMEEFLATSAHELRNPLTALEACTELLQVESDNAARVARLIKAEVRQLTALVNDLFEVSRIRQRKIALAKELVDLSDCVRRVAETLRPDVEQKRQTLELDLERALEVEADPVRIEQIAVNLISNANKYTPDAGSIRISLAREQSSAVLRVRDTGCGMTPEALRGAFEPFAQADERGGGLGLGLSVARGLAKLHGGSLSGESEGPGRGSTFVLKLPLRADEAEA